MTGRGENIGLEQTVWACYMRNGSSVGSHMCVMEYCCTSVGLGVLPEGPAVVPVVGPPVRRTETDGDLKDLCVHHMSHHAQQTCNDMHVVS